MLVIGLILGCVAVDVLTKLLAVTYLKPIGTFPLIQDVLHLTYVENRGAAFGMLADRREVFMILSVVLIVGILAVLYRYWGRLSTFMKVTLSLIVAGGIGNMIDRVSLGYVVDFVDFRLIDFAVFNAADSFISVGAVLLAVYLLFLESKETKMRSRRSETIESEGSSHAD